MTARRFPKEAIPPEVVTVCRRLQGAGHAAYVVGGAVRDLLRAPDNPAAKDFDVATSAPPDDVVRLFGPRRTVPTGIAHGTVTVLCDRHDGEERPRHVEVTTFRGETGYSDGRRPDRVEFITDLVEDLRRRDFTINAIAYDPLADTLHDPFDGQGDLDRRVIRAVGDARQRFAEDGLRLLRAVRFAAQLDFAIDPGTRQAFPASLSTLRKVSRERVRDELLRLLAARRPSRGLVDMLEPGDGPDRFEPTSGLLGVVLPEVAQVLATDEAAPRRLLDLIDATPPERRLATLIFPLRRTELATWPSRRLLDRIDELLKLPTTERQHLAALVAFPEPAYDRRASWPGPTLRRFLAAHPARLVDDFLALREAELAARDDAEPAAAIAELRRRIADERAHAPPLSAGELAVTGKLLLAELKLAPGPSVGNVLRHLLDHVLDDPAQNQRELLLAEARRYLDSTATAGA